LSQSFGQKYWPSQGTEQLPYYTYDLVGADWTATFVVVDSDCFLDSYQKVLSPPFSLPIWHKQNTSVYRNPYTEACHNTIQTQVDFLNTTFLNSNATWKFLQLHHPYVSAAENDTELAPLVEIVAKHQGIVMNGHDHCLGHFYLNDTNFILSGAAGYPQAGDCNNGTAQGPYALYLGANNLTGEWNDPQSACDMTELMFYSGKWLRNYGY
jgi:tartrate-resistant acid phosphatase type 5